MKSNRKLLALALAALSLGAVGCGGFSGSHSISPASFFLPGLSQQAPTVQPGKTLAGISSSSAGHLQ